MFRRFDAARLAIVVIIMSCSRGNDRPMPNVDVRSVWLDCNATGVTRIPSMTWPAFTRVEAIRVGDNVGVTIFGTKENVAKKDPVFKGSVAVRWPRPLPTGVVYVGATGVHGRQELHYYDSCDVFLPSRGGVDGGT
jgi:hypothetical protein